MTQPTEYQWLFDWVFETLDDQKLEALRQIAFDRWNWESGGYNDMILFEAIEAEQHKRQLEKVKTRHERSPRGKIPYDHEHFDMEWASK